MKPAGVVLVSPHGSVFAQRAEYGRVRSHKIDVDSGVQLAICHNRDSEIKRDWNVSLRKMNLSDYETKDRRKEEKLKNLSSFLKGYFTQK